MCSLDPLTRLRQINAVHPGSQSEPSYIEDLKVLPFTGVKSSFWRNPLQWLSQVGTEGKIQSDVHGNSLRNQAERAKAFDDAQTRSDIHSSKVLEIMVDEQTERRAQQQLRRSATNDGINTGDAIVTISGYASLQRPELAEMLKPLPKTLQEKVLREYDLTLAGIVTRLRMQVHGLQDQPVHFDRQELT